MFEKRKKDQPVFKAPKGGKNGGIMPPSITLGRRERMDGGKSGVARQKGTSLTIKQRGERGGRKESIDIEGQKGEKKRTG